MSVEVVDDNRLLAGIAPHIDLQMEIIDAIRCHGGQLDEKAFDRIWSDFFLETDADGFTRMVPKNPRFNVVDYTPGAFVLGGMFCIDPRARVIGLAQLMCAAGILSTDLDRDGLVVYRERLGIREGVMA